MKVTKIIIFTVILSSILPLVSFVSCSNSQQSDMIYYTNEDTLRNLTDKKEKDLVWTRELESVRLLKDISKNEAVSPSLRLSASLFCAVHAEDYSKAIYPVLPGFASLDTSLLMPEIRTLLDFFCEKLSVWSMDNSSFEKEGLFSLALFKYDVENQWETFFKVPFPEKVEPVSESSEKAEESDKKNLQSDEYRLFERWIYGEPFFDEETIEIPVRFYAKKGSLDVLFYASKDTSKLNQILIQKWN